MGSDVDFVVGEQPPPEPTPDGGDGAPARRSRRPLVVALLAVVVLIGAGIAIRSAATNDPTTRKDAASTAPSTAPSGSDAPVTPSPEPTPSLRCVQFTACSTTKQVPASVLAAVRARFPKARVTTATTVLLRRDNAPSAELHDRFVRFVAGTLTLSVSVSTPGTSDGAAIPVGTRTVIRTTDTGQYVTVEAAGPNGATLPSYDVLQSLVADSRLLAT